MQAAKYLGVAPWELMEQPPAWQTWAITAINAEAEANEYQRKKADSGK